MKGKCTATWKVMEKVESKMRKADSVVGDLVYSIISEVSSRFLEVLDRKSVKKIMDDVAQDYDLGQVTFRKRPVRKDNTSGKDGNVSEVMRKTRTSKKQRLTWSKSSIINDGNIPSTLKGTIFCTNEELDLDEDCALVGRYEDDDIVIYGILNNDLQFRYFTHKEAIKFERFSLNVEKDSVKDINDIGFIDIE